MKWLIFGYLVLTAQGTTLVALWRPESIVLAADSRVLTESGTSQACKIVRNGNVWVAAAGLVVEERTGFRLGEIARRALQPNAPLHEQTGKFVTAVGEPLRRAVESVLADSPDELSSLQPGQPVVQAIFATHARGLPVMATVAFVLGKAGTLEAREAYVDGSDKRGPRLIYAGQQQRIREYIRKHPNWVADDAGALVRKLVQVEIDAATPFVAGPIAVLQIESTGTRWIDSSGTCPAH